jgi:hypothetical protein
MYLLPAEKIAHEKHQSVSCKKFFKSRCSGKCIFGKKTRISKMAVYEGRWLNQLETVCPRMNKSWAEHFDVNLPNDLKTLEEIKSLYI